VTRFSSSPIGQFYPFILPLLFVSGLSGLFSFMLDQSMSLDKIVEQIKNPKRFGFFGSSMNNK